MNSKKIGHIPQAWGHILKVLINRMSRPFMKMSRLKVPLLSPFAVGQEY
jgi:hypothetical protein